MFKNTRKSTQVIFVGILALMPQLAFAQQVKSFKDLVGLGMKFIQLGTAILMSLLAMASIYLAFTYIQQSRTGDKSMAATRERMIYAVIGTAVIFSIWGLVSLITNTFGVTEIGIPHFSAPS